MRRALRGLVAAFVGAATLIASNAPARAKGPVPNHLPLADEPDPAFVYETVAETDPERASLEEFFILAAGYAQYGLNKNANERDWVVGTNWDGLKRKLTFGASAFDDNHFDTNWLTHPASGFFYYGAARGNRLGVVSSLAMSFATSFLWEMFGEVREATSWNDIISTPTSGAPIAESFLQVGALMHRSKKTPLTVSAGWLFAPFKSAHDALDGLTPRHAERVDDLGFADDVWHRFTIGAAGGAAKTVTTDPGHYRRPRFSPDGKTIVFEKRGSGGLTSTRWSEDTGVYRMAASGGTAELVSRDGAKPQYGATNDRIFMVTAGDGKSQLVSTDLSGQDKRTHANGELVSDYEISPDGGTLAFRQNYDAYVTPLMPGGQDVSLGTKSGALPVTRVSGSGAEYIHWSDGGRRLHWSRGATLFSADLARLFTNAPADDKAPKFTPPTDGVSLAMTQAVAKRRGTVVITGARIVTMAGADGGIIDNGAIVIEGDRITAVGPLASISVPTGAVTIDATGKTIVPGFVDAHAHGSHGDDELIPQQNWSEIVNLAMGTTTSHNPSSRASEIFVSSEMQRAGLILAPRIFSTGEIIYGAKAAGVYAEINGYDDALAHVRRLKAQGAHSVKNYNQPRRDQRQEVLVAAREEGIMVVPEGGSLFQHNMNMVIDGHTGVEHSIPMAKVYADVVQLWSGTKVGYTPTLIVGYGGIWGENYWYDKTHVWEDERLLSFVPREIIDERSRRRVTAPDEEYTHIRNAEVAKRLSDAGVSVQLGAHGQREGLGAHWELWMFAQGGMTPLEALRSATLRGAQYLGMDKDIGSLEPGKLADLVILSANPLEDIRNSTSIDQVVLNGRVYDGKTMNEAGAKPQKHEPFFWQQPGRASVGTTTFASSDGD